MAQYIINFTDGNKSPFNISPYTTNGPVSPIVLSLDSSAVSANTSLLFYGQGMPNYGERIQENMLHIMEHFSGPTAPTYAIEGQMWYDSPAGIGSPVQANKLKIYNGASWNEVILSTGTSAMAAVLDMGSNQINNLADPTNPQDALTLGFADGRYLNISGDGMTAALDMNSNQTQ
jgi:hypothetical protein